MVPAWMEGVSPPLRPFQIQALQALARAPAHVICVAPTGSGKTRIIQEFVERNRDSRAVLFSPLVALSRQHFQALCVPSIWCSASRIPGPPLGQEAGLWILSPESLWNPGTRRALRSWRPDFWAIDECHCLWDWGESFRPAFNEIPRILNEVNPNGRSLWLTATLPSAARKELKQSLPTPSIEIGEFDLPRSLHLKVEQSPWEERTQRLLEWITDHPEGGIVFAQSRKSTERLFRLLTEQRDLGRTVFPYHAGLSLEEKLVIEERIRLSEAPLVVATSAFGMGMNLIQLKWVCLWQAPPSLLSLTQSIGRVGRQADTRSEALILWDPDDFQLLEWIGSGSPRRQEELLETFSFLRSRECRRIWLGNYFSASIREKCHRCDTCLQEIMRN